MTAQQFEVMIDELPVLTPKDLRHFDKEAVDLVLEYQVHGWTGWLSANMHAIMRAPDGDGTASISRKYRRKRSAEIMRRPLDQWLRRREREREDRERVDAFGRPPTSDSVKLESPDPPWQIATQQSYDARLRMQKATRDWWEGVREAGSGNTVWQLLEDGEDDWVLVSGKRADKLISIVSIGPATDPSQLEKLRLQIEQTNKREGKHPMDNEGPQTAVKEEKKYLCPEPGCKDLPSFKNQSGLNLHANTHNAAGFECPLCDRVLRTPAARGVHLSGNVHAGDPRLAKARAALKKNVATKPYKNLPEGTLRNCEYGCGKELPPMSMGGHHRWHQQQGHTKTTEHGDGATQPVKAIAVPDSPPKAPAAATEAPAKREPVVVAAVPVVVEPVAVNGTGKKDSPEALLSMVRTLVNPELVGENERLRTRCERLEEELIAKTAECEEIQARLDMVKEAMNA